MEDTKTETNNKTYENSSGWSPLEEKNEKENIHIPQNICSLFGEVIESDGKEDFTVRVYRLKNNNREAPAYCGKFENEELDEEILGERFGIGKYKCVLHFPKNRKNFTKTVLIDDSFVNPTKRTGNPSAEGGPTLEIMREILSMVRPFILDRPIPQESPLINFEKLSQMMTAQFEKMQQSYFNLQKKQLEDARTMKVGNIEELENEGSEKGLAEILFQQLSPFIPLILKGLIPKQVIDNVVGDMGLKEELEAKGELFDELCIKLKEELGEEKTQALIKKAIG